MSLEEVLRVMEKDNGERRNPEKYYFSIFGTPSEQRQLGLPRGGPPPQPELHRRQRQGGRRRPASSAPTRPKCAQGPRAGLRVLAAEEDLGRDLLSSLDDGQKKVAIVDPNAYKDILTADSRNAALKGQPSGLSATKMNAKQLRTLMALLDEYATTCPSSWRLCARTRSAKPARTSSSPGPAAATGDPHYYRIQSPTFLIEYDNTQNGANHIHSVWRDFNGDFGEDMLKEHYKPSHKK